VTHFVPQVDSAELFPGDGEMARRCREIDWSATALGPVEQWPVAQRIVVRMVIECPFPTSLWCGPTLILIYNDAYRSLLGAKHPGALAQCGADVWAEVWPALEPMFALIRRGGPPVYAEDSRFVVQRADGPPEDAWFTFSLSPVRDDSGSIVAFLNVAAESTRRIRTDAETELARAAAERAERQLRDVFAQAPAFLAVLRGPLHVFEFANEAYMQLVGERELIGKPLDDALPEVRKQGFIDLLDRVLATGEPFIGREISIMLKRSPDGPPERAFIDFVYQPIRGEGGERVGVVAHGYDVTDAVLARQEIERLLHESEEARSLAERSEARYRFLADAIPVQVWTATPEGAIDYVSDRAARYFGRTPEQVVGDQWREVLHPDDVARATERWRRSVVTGDPYQTEFRLWSAEHQTFRWHLVRATAQRDDDGTVLRWFGTNTEIEDWKQAEAELQRLTAEATEANHAKSDFLAAMSHELRTPLNAIGGYAQLIELGMRGPITEEQRIDLLKIQRSKNHLDALVSDVLNFAKLRAGRIDFRVREVNVADVLESVLEMIGPQLEQKSLQLVPFSAPRGLAVWTDKDKMRQILLNLLGNALKFTPAKGTIALTLDVDVTDVAISVSDTGIGISADQLERIFEPFVQAKHALYVGDHGVGLGLAISRQLARAMHGDLTVRSAIGQGSTFTLRLPRVDA
jgi:PAS domain S-box-containing protein